MDVVTDALGLDVRIGRSYLKGALGYGGPCFPRDNVALSFFARQVGLQPILPEATDEANRRLVSDIVHCFREELGEASVVAVLGLAYKPETHVVEESHSIMIAEALAAEGHRIVAHDPMAGDEARGVLQGPVTVVDSLAEALGGADVVLVTTPDPAFRGLRADDFLRGRKAVTVIDFWRALGNDVSAHPRIRYRALGRSDYDEQNALRLKRLWGLTTAESV